LRILCAGRHALPSVAQPSAPAGPTLAPVWPTAKPFPTVDAGMLQPLARRSGIDRDSIVVFHGYAAALGFWLMSLYRHADVRMLDCSRETWRAGGRPWSRSTGQPVTSAYQIGGQDPRVRADRAAVEEAIPRPR